MLLGAQRLDSSALPDSSATASADAPQAAQSAAAAAAPQLGREDSGAGVAAGADGSAPRGGSWRSLGGGGEQPTAAGSQHRGSGSVVVLDVRNGYEWDAGHFQGAARPSEASCSDRFCFPACQPNLSCSVWLPGDCASAGCGFACEDTTWCIPLRICS